MNTISYISPLLPSIEEYTELLKEVWDAKYLTNNGPKCIAFENALKEYLHAENVACFVNGHLALDSAVKALELTGEVITTPFTFASTMQAIITNRLTPVFCDIDPETLCIDVDKIEALITDKTSAIMPVHVFGRPCDTKKLDEISKRYNIPVIYDAAHTFGCEQNGVSLANAGDVSMISFHATKVFNSIEGGALVFNNAELYKKVKNTANFGIVDGDVAIEGTNGKMNEFQACMGICNLRYVDEEIEARKEVFEVYDEKLAGIKGLKCPIIPEELSRYNYSYYPIIIDEAEFGCNADELCDYLVENKIIARRYFTPSLNDTGIVAAKGINPGSTPVARDIVKRIISLPVHGNLTMKDMERIAHTIKEKGKN